MAIHPNTASMLKESVIEMLFTAKYCIKYRKGSNWGSNQTGGCLGYPAAIILFSIADTIGSFCEGNKSFKIKIDGKDKVINSNNFEHFYILNSKYYNQNLDEIAIKKIYQNFRSLLVHNLSLPPEHFLTIGHVWEELLGFVNDPRGKKHPIINLLPFLRISGYAVSEFIKDIDLLVPASKQQKNIKAKIF